MSKLVPVAIFALITVSACSKPAGGGGQGQATAAPAMANAGNACDRKLVTQADIAPLLSEPIANMKALPGDPQSCTFTTSGYSSVTVSLRPGMGKSIIDMISSGKTNQTVTPLAGVGERAVWDPTLKEVDAEKNGTLCMVGAIGPASHGATADKVGAVCNKILAGI